MRIQSIDNRTNFGNLCGIRCNRSVENGFYFNSDKRILLINDLLKSKAFKEFGEQYDYDAVFNFSSDALNTRTYEFDAFKYELKIVPAKKPTPDKKFRNLPIDEITVLHFQFFYACLFGRVLNVIRQTDFALPCHIVEKVREAVRGEAIAVNLSVRKIVPFECLFPVQRTPFLRDPKNRIAVLVVDLRVPFPYPRRRLLQKMDEKGVVTPTEPEIVVE